MVAPAEAAASLSRGRAQAQAARQDAARAGAARGAAAVPAAHARDGGGAGCICATHAAARRAVTRWGVVIGARASLCGRAASPGVGRAWSGEAGAGNVCERRGAAQRRGAQDKRLRAAAADAAASASPPKGPGCEIWTRGSTTSPARTRPSGELFSVCCHKNKTLSSSYFFPPPLPPPRFPPPPPSAAQSLYSAQSGKHSEMNRLKRGK